MVGRSDNANYFYSYKIQLKLFFKNKKVMPLEGFEPTKMYMRRYPLLVNCLNR